MLSVQVGPWMRRGALAGRWHVSTIAYKFQFRVLSSKPVTPDFNTSVNVAEHRCCFLNLDVQAGASGALPSTNCDCGNVSSISLRKTRAKKLEELHKTTSHSLVAESIKHVEEDEEHMITADALRKLGQAQLTREERIKRRRALDTIGVPTFDEFLRQQKLALDKGKIEILQMNIGLYCNQACNHCHVESSPKRSEMMSEEVARRCMVCATSCSPSCEECACRM